MLWQHYIKAITLALFLMIGCDAGGRVVITLRKYQNKSHRKSDGKCCDHTWFKCAPCDAYFKLCVTDSSPNRDTCNLGRSVTEVVGRGDHHDNINIRREFRFSWFSGVLRLYLEVWDKDKVTRDDFVEATHKTLHSVKPGNSPKVPYQKSLSLSGQRINVALDVEVYCDSYYHGDKCNVWCQPHEDSTGHYTCDVEGQKVCKPDWYGAECSRRCVPMGDPVDGHFYCDKHGNKKCLLNWKAPDCRSCEKNWFGPKCASYCVPQNDDTIGHYNCRSTDGKKECLPEWFGPKCLAHCVSRDDDQGHYSCAHDGSKQCMTGWYGENCTTFCIPYEGEEGGLYICDDKGNQICQEGYKPPECKECLPGSYGANCSLPCLPLADTQQKGHYDCFHPGIKRCKVWWYGPDCNQYCVPHDDSEHGHYTCDERDGSKKCWDGWEGPNCLQPTPDEE